VRHHVQRGVIPVNQFAVVPDFVGLLDTHRDSLQVKVATRGAIPPAGNILRREPNPRYRSLYRVDRTLLSAAFDFRLSPFRT
jgi:hypothetical protein